jgi:hypothetical protein
MVTLATRIDEIFAVEGFKIKVEDLDKDPVGLGEHGVLERYPFKKSLPGEKTVGDWKRLRFSPMRTDCDCSVLLGTGKSAKDGLALTDVRGSYV